MGNVTVTIHTVDDQPVPAAIDDVLVRVFDELDVYLTEGLTGAVTPGSGEVDFTLPGDIDGIDHIVRLYKEGVSFPPAPTFNISVTDPPNPNNTFQFTGHVGMVGQLVTFSVKTDDAVPVAVPDARIRVFTDGGVFITEVFSDSSGEAELVLEGDPYPGRIYVIRLFKQGWSFPNGAKQVTAVMDPLVAPNTNIFDIVATTPTIPESSNPEMVRLSGYLTDASGQPMRDTSLRFTPRMHEPGARVSGFPFPGDPTIVDRMQMFDEATTVTDREGYVEVELPRLAIFDVHHHGFVLPSHTSYAQIFTPDRAGAKLEDVLFPYVSSVDYDAIDVSLAAGDSEEVLLAVLGSNDQPIEGKQSLDCLLEFSTLDENIATVEISQDGKLVVTAVGAGTTTVVVDRVPDTHAPRRPEIQDLTVLDLSVEVT